jgi:DNA-binding MarR family transcriptional regulator
MSEQQMQDQLNWLLLRALLQIKHSLIKLSEEQGLTIMQTFTLALLEPGKAVPMNSLSTMLFCDASNVTGIVDRLVWHKLIERKELPQDRRVKTIELTTKGVEARRQLLAKTLEMQLPGIGTLNKEEAETLKNLLTRTLASCAIDRK